MKTRSFVVFFLILAVLGLGIFTALNGLQVGNYTVEPINKSMKLGLDIEGGVFVVLEADTAATGETLKKIMNQTQEVIRRRVDAMGLTEPNIVLEGEKRIRIELPGAKNAQEALEAIGKTAQLQFIKTDGEVVLTGNDVRNAELTFDEHNNPAVSLELNSQGSEAFRLATREVSKLASPDNILPIILDEEILSAPVVGGEIPGGRAIITGNFTTETASNLAALIRGGALPVNLDEVQTSAIGPTLGLDSLNTSVNAGMIGLSLVLLFMLMYYRVPGFIASIALLFYILIVLYVLIGLNATLTLPGVAGLILSVGMAVDANVIIFERFKEEMLNGKTIRSSIDAGFSKALRTILDSNITTFIAAIVLYSFGLGPIKGFAITLMIGIISSMFTAVFITKFLLKLVISMDILKNKKLFGV